MQMSAPSRELVPLMVMMVSDPHLHSHLYSVGADVQRVLHPDRLWSFCVSSPSNTSGGGGGSTTDTIVLCMRAWFVGEVSDRE